MSKIHWTDEDLSLFARVLIFMRPWTAVILAIYGLATTAIIFRSLVLALAGAALISIGMMSLSYVVILRKMHKLWRLQAPDGVIQVDVAEKGWRVASQSMSSEYDWSFFMKRYEFMGCYILKLRSYGVIVYRKDYFDQNERMLIEAKIRKVPFWFK